MANIQRSVYTLLFSRRSVLLLLAIFAVYKTMYQARIKFYNSKLLEAQEEVENQESKNFSLVFTLLPKYPAIPFNESPRRPRTLLERDLKRLRSKATTISANRAANAVNKLSPVFPVRGNIYPDGLYYVVIQFGRLAKTYYLDMDTGSDLSWLQCDAPCRSCGNGPNGLYDGKKARVVDCRHALCAVIQRGRSYECDVNLSGRWTECHYDVEYADGSSTMGFLMEDFIIYLLSNGSRSHARAIIGCGYDQQGALAKDQALTDGVMGLSNSKVALPSQLAQAGIVNNVIGQCLGDGKSSNSGNHLFFGDALVPSSGMTWVPMMGSRHKEGYYQARMRRIHYGADELDKTGAVDDVTFDSGTTFTYFVPEAYVAVLSAVLAQAKRWELVRDQLDTTLPFCWAGDSLFESVSDVHRYFKTISLDFGCSRILELSPDGYLITSARGNVCLGILDAKEASLEVTNVIGDISMRGYLIVYDNVRDRIGWVRKDCRNQPTRPT